MTDPMRGPPVARKRFYLGGPLLVGLIYFYGHVYPWARSCLVRSVQAAREAHGPPSVPPVRLVSFRWCLLMTLDRLNTVAPPGSGGPSDH
jgi:hypothetical protein